MRRQGLPDRRIWRRAGWWGAASGFVLLAACSPSRAAVSQEGLPEARARLWKGDYEGGLAVLRSLARPPEARPEAGRLLVRTLLELGRHDEALRWVEDPQGGKAASLELETVYGEALRAVGRSREAEEAFRRALQGGAGDASTARLNLGIVLWERGERDEARGVFDSFIDLYNQARNPLSAEDLMAVGTAVRYLAVTSPVLYQDALMAFDEAARADTLDPRPELLVGELFLEKYRATDAREAFRKVLQANPRHPRALLGLARVLDFEESAGAADTVRLALQVNPRYADARAFLARLHLKAEDFASATTEARRALEVNPEHLGAWSVLAAVDFLAGDEASFRRRQTQALALNPRYGELFATVAEMAVLQRRYQEAVSLAEEAVKVDSTLWRGWGILGMNGIRIGAMDRGRQALERAFAGDPYNPWYKNTLDLLDTFAHYRIVRTPHFEILLHGREADVLEPYVKDAAEAAYGALRSRYGADPPLPIRLELFPSHADFSVRTLGLPGLGALGVSFGSTLVMDSPSAQPPGSFNWVSTLWHEVAHAFHLALSGHRVPRWFTEGLAVVDQRRFQPRWGFPLTPAWLQAYEEGRIHPPSRLGEGFVRPRYPEELQFSYYQASLVLEYIEGRWGLPRVRQMLQAYREGGSNEEVFQGVLGVGLEAFDRDFDAWVRARFQERARALSLPPGVAGDFHRLGVEELRRLSQRVPGNFQVRLALAKALLEAGTVAAAERELREAVRLFPEYSGPDSPYLFLARIHQERGEKDQAARAFQRLGDLSETALEAHLQEASLWSALGRRADAAQALEKALELAPFDIGIHRQLAELFEAQGDHARRVRERRAILALNPPDRADAHYQLALALRDSGDREGARREVLRALEIAPAFEAAQELLLELRRRNP